MENIFVNTYNKRPLIVERGEGSFLYDNAGKRYLDYLSGISINNWGYCNKTINDAIYQQINKVTHPSNYYYTRPQFDLAEKLIKLSGLDKVFFTNSGTEANEAVLLFLSKYQGKQSIKNEVIVFDGSFLGRTYGSRMATSGNSVEDLKFIRVAFNDIDAFKKAVSNKTLAIYLELVLGHGGIKKFDHTIVVEIIDICKRMGILVCVDEVQTGLGRTGQTFLFKEYNIKPDSVTLGKSLGGGIPLSVALVSNRLSDSISPGDYGCTMGGNSLACAAGSQIIDFLSEPDVIKKIRENGIYLFDSLVELKKKRKQIIDIRCYGMMCGCDVEKDLAPNIVQRAFSNGLLIDHVNKNTLRLLPPLNTTFEEIDQAVSILNNSF